MHWNEDEGLGASALCQRTSYPRSFVYPVPPPSDFPRTPGAIRSDSSEPAPGGSFPNLQLTWRAAPTPHSDCQWAPPSLPLRSWQMWNSSKHSLNYSRGKRESRGVWERSSAPDKLKCLFPSRQCISLSLWLTYWMLVAKLYEMQIGLLWKWSSKRF